MATIHVELPGLLAAVNDGCSVFSFDAATLGDALAAIKRDHPRLALHLFDETGRLRPHVLCLHNGVNTRWMETLERPLSAGDRLRFLQAVSGG